MKNGVKLVLASVLMSAALQTPAFADDHGETASANLALTISGFSTLEGTVRVGVFATEDGWNESDAVSGAGVAVDAAELTVTISDLPPGEYGLKLYHDVDGNGELNTNMMGIPTEPYAFSNDARGRFGPASWEDARFSVAAGDNSHRVSIR